MGTSHSLDICQFLFPFHSLHTVLSFYYLVHLGLLPFATFVSYYPGIIMRSGLFAAATAALAGSVAGQVVKRQSGSLPTIETRGNAFYTAGGERFYVRGVAYQPGGAAEAEDPLLDTEALSRDIEQFERLGINTIRIYTIDNSQNHDESGASSVYAGAASLVISFAAAGALL